MNVRTGRGRAGARRDWTFWDEAWSWPGLTSYSLLAVDLPGSGRRRRSGRSRFDVVVERLARLVEHCQAL
jgi:hypothetical protein